MTFEFCFEFKLKRIKALRLIAKAMLIKLFNPRLKPGAKAKQNAALAFNKDFD